MSSRETESQVRIRVARRFLREVEESRNRWNRGVDQKLLSAGVLDKTAEGSARGPIEFGNPQCNAKARIGLSSVIPPEKCV